jgi:hypothetical protein
MPCQLLGLPALRTLVWPLRIAELYSSVGIGFTRGLPRMGFTVGYPQYELSMEHMYIYMCVFVLKLCKYVTFEVICEVICEMTCVYLWCTFEALHLLRCVHPPWLYTLPDHVPSRL